MFLSEIYARRHGFDAGLLISYIYIEGTIAFGAIIRHKILPVAADEISNYVYSSILGILGISCFIWLLSAVHLGSVREIQIGVGTVILSSLLVLRKFHLCSLLKANTIQPRWKYSAAMSGALVCILMMFAKAQVSTSYDSLWYGLRGDRVLVAAGSVFSSQGLVALVHYYPKAYEMFLIPLSGLDSISSIIGASIWIWLVLGVVIWAIGRELGWNSWLCTACTACILSIPALMNIGITAKGDLASALLVMEGLWAQIRNLSSSSWSKLGFAFSCLVTAPLYRLSVIPYVVILGVLWIYQIIKTAKLFATKKSGVTSNVDNSQAIKPMVLFIMIGMLLFVLVEVRTLLLAGVPFVAPRSVVSFTHMLGMSLSYPIGISPDRSFTKEVNIFSLLNNFLLHPSRLPHVIISWTGSIWANFLIISVLIPGSSKAMCEKLVPIGMVAVLFPFILSVRHFGVLGGDGNYFIVPIACLTIIAFHRIAATYELKGAAGGILQVVVVVSVAICVLTSLVTGNWGPGTRHGTQIFIGAQ